ncbi:primase C-terminal domain-containing protein, partial [Salmonella enterica]|uniref:primase C-terminal domain-containing protein n=1 Tax=Salmonella enterica TaxID=28901 RepID=UPI001F43342E
MRGEDPPQPHGPVCKCEARRSGRGDTQSGLGVVPGSDRLRRLPDDGLGRNCTLFDKTRKWAYRAIRQGWPEYGQWMLACVERATAYNMQFSAPLDEKEVISIAKSISKWTYSKFTQQSFDEYVKKTHSAECQSIRGRKSSGGGRPKIRSEEWVSLG